MSRIVIEKNISYDDVRDRYYVSMDYGKDEAGKRRQVREVFRTKKEAQTRLAKFTLEVRQSVDKVIPSKTTVAEYCDYWLKVEKDNVAKTTRYGYRNIIDKHIVPSLGSKALQAVSREDIKTYLKAKGEVLSSNTVRKHYDLLNSVFHAAVLNGRITRNPLASVQPVRCSKGKSAVYGEKELKDLFAKVKGNRLEIAVNLAGRMGLRRAEVCGLRWQDVDLEAKTLYVCNTITQAGNEKAIEKAPKSESSVRTLAIPAPLLALLHEVQKGQEENKAFFEQAYQGDYVFCWPNGRPYSPNYLSDMFSKFLEENGLRHIRFHDLRHSFASLAVNQASVYDVSLALGHSNSRITEDIYIERNKQCKAVAIAAVSSVLDS